MCKRNEEIINYILKLLLKEKEKEYYCHIQFVHLIGLHLTKRFGGDSYTVEIACLLHDIGRDNEIDGESHPEASLRIATQILENFGICAEHTKIIKQCIVNHGMEVTPQYIEEKIVITSDAASKVVYHEAFMLMCKKTTCSERAAWGLGYVEKGFQKILFDEYKLEVQHGYLKLKDTYSKVLERL